MTMEKLVLTSAASIVTTVVLARGPADEGLKAKLAVLSRGRLRIQQ